MLKQLTEEYYNVLEVFLDDDRSLINCMQVLETCVKSHLARGVPMDRVYRTVAEQNERVSTVGVALKRKTATRMNNWVTCVKAMLERVRGDVNIMRNIVLNDVRHVDEECGGAVNIDPLLAFLKSANLKSAKTVDPLLGSISKKVINLA